MTKAKLKLRNGVVSMETSPTFMLDRDYSRFTVKEKTALFRKLWERLYAILDTYFSGYFVMSDDNLNRYYIRICLIIEKLLAEADEELTYVRDLWESYGRPFESLYADWNDGDIHWKDGGVEKRTLELRGAIDEAFVKLGEPKFVDLATNKFLSEVDEYLTTYSKSKRAKEKQFEKNMEKEAKKFKEGFQVKIEPEKQTKRKLGFIKD